jgi:3-oxoacyl-(acyl-carrier-protein) synthase
VIVVTGFGRVVLDGDEAPSRCDPTPFLRSRKTRKYLGLQDDMAVVSAGSAADMAGLGRNLGERAGLYVAVGYIPFHAADIDPVLEGSLQEGQFSMQRFSSDGYLRAHPLTAFRCLPNMPAYHVSQSLDVQGPYFVTYPGPAQFHQAAELACQALASGEIDVALVGGVAAQKNFLVEHHYGRIPAPVSASKLRDASAFLVLEEHTRAAARGARAHCCFESLSMAYTPFDPASAWPTPASETHVDGDRISPDGELGAAALAVLVADFAASGHRRLEHFIRSRDGISARSVWSKAA